MTESSIRIKPTKKLFLTQKIEELGWKSEKMVVKEIVFHERLLGSIVEVHLLNLFHRDTGEVWRYFYADCPESIRKQIELSISKK